MTMRKVGKVFAWVGGLLVTGLAVASMWFWLRPSA